MADKGSYWYDTYNYGYGANNPTSRVVRVESDYEDANNMVTVRTVGGSGLGATHEGRRTKVRADRFDAAGGFRPATDASMGVVQAKYREPYVDSPDPKSPNR